jgi:hypothetical protein
VTAISQALVLFVDKLKFTRLRAKFVEFFKLVFQKLSTGCTFLALLLVLGKLTAALMPLAIVLRHALSKCVLTCIAIKQRFLLLRFNELLVRVLAVDLNE